MKVSKETPEWAVELIKTVCKDYTRKLPGELDWTNHPDRKHSSGWCTYDRTRNGGQIHHSRRLVNGKLKLKPFRGRIRIHAGENLAGQRIVLLHEIAHWLTARKRAESHTVRFWRIAWELFHSYEADIEYALQSEGNYKKFSLVVYDREYGPKE